MTRAVGLSTTRPEWTASRHYCVGQFQPERRKCRDEARVVVGSLRFCIDHGARAVADSLEGWLRKRGVTGPAVDRG